MTKEILWNTLNNKAQLLRGCRLSMLFTENPQRTSHFSLTVDDIHLDYSKNFLTKEILADLCELANTCQLSSAIKALYSGKNLNITENRPALHIALRQTVSSLHYFDDVAISRAIMTEKEKMYRIVQRLQQGQWLGHTGKVITDVVNLGIGGSDLGPRMTVEALKPFSQSTLKIHFVSNIDPIEMASLLPELNPETTLFIISSKSFTTIETLTNAIVAKNWLQTHLDADPFKNHFIAVTASAEKATAFGILPENMLCFGEWVGGRYSIWSTIGLPLALSIGVTHFEAFLQGARQMDQHFASAPFTENMPILLALIGIWYINFWQAPSIAVLPYAAGLSQFPNYLQQLDMESNGKSVQISGKSVSHATGPIVWGQTGTNGQHAFYQLLHQGTHFIPVDFIVAAQSNTHHHGQHRQLIAHCFAQAQALMEGNHDNTPHHHMPGNKPSNILLLKKLTPCSLGQLLALYEHKVFVQGVIWQINSFDQPGVELGKKLANSVATQLETGKLKENVDPSTYALIQKVRDLHSY